MYEVGPRLAIFSLSVRDARELCCTVCNTANGNYLR